MSQPKARTTSNFLLLGMPRVGTNWTAHYLNSLDGVYCFNELFGQNPTGVSSYANDARQRFSRWQRSVHPVQSRIAYLEQILASKPDEDQVGAKLLYSHLCWPSKGALDHPGIHAATRMKSLERWIDEKDVLVIALVRQNALKAVVSRRLAARDGTWHAKHGERQRETIEIDTRRLLKDLEAFERQQQGVIEVARRHRHAVVPYELDENERYRALAKALGTSWSGEAPSLTTTKQTKDDLSQVVVNYDEVSRLLTGTTFEHFIDH